MADSVGFATKSPPPKPDGTVEQMRSGNLQLYTQDYVENMQSGALQQDFAENTPSGGLQYYDSASDKEPSPTAALDEKIDPEPLAKRKILGLSRRIFWFLIAGVVFLLVVGAVVGGVIGSQKHASTTSYAIPQVSSTQSAASITNTGSSTGATTVVSTTSFTSPSITSSSSTQTATTTALPFITPTRANPVDVDGNYFVNCNNTQIGHSSGMAYYKHLVPGSNIGTGPDDYVGVTNGSYVTWENGGVVTFRTGVPLHWSTLSDLGSNQRAGTADNAYENFFVYKDAGEFLYSVGNWSCYSMYWAF